MMRDSEPKLPIHCSQPTTTNTTALGTGMGKKNGDMFEGSIGNGRCNNSFNIRYLFYKT